MYKPGDNIGELAEIGQTEEGDSFIGHYVYTENSYTLQPDTNWTGIIDNSWDAYDQITSITYLGKEYQV